MISRHSHVDSRSAVRFGATIETLERRMCLAVALGTNLIVNGDAETGSGTDDGATLESIPGWAYTVEMRHISAFKYSSNKGPILTTTAGPGARGSNYFYGGLKASSAAIAQTIDLSPLAVDIDAGRIKFTLSGWFGGRSTIEDTASLLASFRNNEATGFNPPLIGKFTAADRDNQSALLFDSATGTVPAGMRTVSIFVGFENKNGGDSDGVADNLVFKLASTLGKKGQIAGTIFNDRNGDGVKQLGEDGVTAIKVFADLNKDGKLQTTEPSASTDPSGAYTLTGLPAGTTNVLTIVPAGFRAISTNPAKVPVVAGLTSTQDLFLSQAGVITGAVFVDDNANGKRDGAEAAVPGAIVYLDFNNNGQQDDFELTATANSKGAYKFNVHHGKYIVRLAAPKGFKTASPSPALAWTINLAKGGLAKGLNFGVTRL